MTAGAGLVVFDKPAGWTSHDVVARARRALGTRKVGHAGTLDPMATGVLVLGFGRATRLLGHLLLADKTYSATVRLGQSTTTDDAEGEVAETTSAAGIGEEAVVEALRQFVGDIDQVPTTVSAIKVGGKRAYDLMREGKKVDLLARRVTVHSADATGFRRDGTFLDFELRVSCSSGTYIRAIARDLGAALGVGGHLTALRRHSVGPYTLDQADIDFDDVHPVSVEDAARAAFPAVSIDAEHALRVGFGHSFSDLDLPEPQPVALFGPDGTFLALYETRDDAARPVAVFV